MSVQEYTLQVRNKKEGWVAFEETVRAPLELIPNCIVHLLAEAQKVIDIYDTVNNPMPVTPLNCQYCHQPYASKDKLRQHEENLHNWRLTE